MVYDVQYPPLIRLPKDSSIIVQLSMLVLYKAYIVIK